METRCSATQLFFFFSKFKGGTESTFSPHHSFASPGAGMCFGCFPEAAQPPKQFVQRQKKIEHLRISGGRREAPGGVKSSFLKPQEVDSGH